MRLKLAGDNALESLGLTFGLVPRALVTITLGPGYARPAVAALRLGVFEALDQGPADAALLAQRLGCSPAGTQALANCLVGAGLLQRTGGCYRNHPDTEKWLLVRSPNSLREAALFVGYCQEMLGDLEATVRSGEVLRLHDRQHPPEFWASYMGALAAFARIAGKEVQRRVKLNQPRRLLDVGGGHGLYGAALCRKYPGLSSEVLDLAPACAAGRAIIQAEGMQDRVRHREGDFREADWGVDHDAILVFNVLHNANAEEAQLLLRRARAALRPGGTLIPQRRRPQGRGRRTGRQRWLERAVLLLDQRGAGMAGAATAGVAPRGGLRRHPALRAAGRSQLPHAGALTRRQFSSGRGNGSPEGGASSVDRERRSHDPVRPARLYPC